ncbi:MAG TPA: DUF2934 domain-containing protein [Steroidobacteraceae bacterium]|nr:DUF2934 domain-containing protein [Steroidobacteraceae bacterium]
MVAPQFVNPATSTPAQRACGDGQAREAMIRKAAQLLAQWRGLASGPQPDPEDWLTAARQIDELLRVCRGALDTRARAPSVADMLRSQSART